MTGLTDLQAATLDKAPAEWGPTPTAAHAKTMAALETKGYIEQRAVCSWGARPTTSCAVGAGVWRITPRGRKARLGRPLVHDFARRGPDAYRNAGIVGIEA